MRLVLVQLHPVLWWNRISRLWDLCPLTFRTMSVGVLQAGFFYFVISRLFEWLVGEPLILPSTAGSTASAVNPNVLLALITLYGVVAGYVYNNREQARREAKTRQFAEKQKTYESFFNILYNTLHQGETGIPKMSNRQSLIQMRAFQKKLLVWGSAETINAYHMFLNQSSDATNQKYAEKLMRAMRRDLGHEDGLLLRNGLNKVLIRNSDHVELDSNYILPLTTLVRKLLVKCRNFWTFITRTKTNE